MADSIRLLQPEDEELVLHLFERCREYFENVEGRSPSRDVAYEILTQLPPGKQKKEKQVFGFFDDEDRLTALVDLVRDYPVDKEWIIGLLLVAPEHRGRGMAQKIHDYIQTHASGNGAALLRVAVLEINEPGRRFWQGMGYYEIKRVPYPRGEGVTTAIVMNKKTGSAD